MEISDILNLDVLKISQKSNEIYIENKNKELQKITKLQKEKLLNYFQELIPKIRNLENTQDIKNEIKRINNSAENDIPSFFTKHMFDLKKKKKNEDEDDQSNESYRNDEDQEEEENEDEQLDDEDENQYEYKRVNESIWNKYDRQSRLFEQQYQQKKLSVHQQQQLNKQLAQKQLLYLDYFQNNKQIEQKQVDLFEQYIDYSKISGEFLNLLINLSKQNYDFETTFNLIPLKNNSSEIIQIEKLYFANLQYFPHLNANRENCYPWISTNQYYCLQNKLKNKGIYLNVEELYLTLANYNMPTEQCSEDYQLCSECITIIESQHIDFTKRLIKQVINTENIITDKIIISLDWNYGNIPEVIFHQPLKKLIIKGDNIGIMPKFENNSFIYKIVIVNERIYLSDLIVFILQYYINKVGVVKIANKGNGRYQKIGSSRKIDADKLFDSSISFCFDWGIRQIIKGQNRMQYTDLLSYHLNQKYKQMLQAATFFSSFKDIFSVNPNFIFQDLYFD